MSNGTDYPAWVGDSTTMYRYYVYPKIPFAVIQQHPVGYWQGRCYGSRTDPPCPQKFGPYYSQQAALNAMTSHCQEIHYIVPA